MSGKQIIDMQNLSPNWNEVSDAMHIDEKSDIYHRYKEEFDILCPTIMRIIQPKVYMGIGDHDEYGKLLVVIFTLGNQISEYSTDLFHKDEYVKGLLTDGIADHLLFKMDDCAGKDIVDFCNRNHVRMEERVEIPEKYPFELLSYGVELFLKSELGEVCINEQFVLEPAKSICNIFILNKGEGNCYISHSCEKCGNQACNHRRSG